MLHLPARFAVVILCFAPLFRQLTWRHAQVLLIGAILVPGQRTVASILRVSGLCWERRFVNYHSVLNSAAWSGRAGTMPIPSARAAPGDATMRCHVSSRFSAPHDMASSPRWRR